MLYNVWLRSWKKSERNKKMPDWDNSRVQATSVVGENPVAQALIYIGDCIRALGSTFEQDIFGALL